MTAITSQIKDEHIAAKNRTIERKTGQIHQQRKEMETKDEQIQHLQANMQTLRTQMEVYTLVSMMHICHF